jgi:hypothetical protein
MFPRKRIEVVSGNNFISWAIIMLSKKMSFFPFENMVALSYFGNFFSFISFVDEKIIKQKV